MEDGKLYVHFWHFIGKALVMLMREMECKNVREAYTEVRLNEEDREF